MFRLFKSLFNKRFKNLTVVLWVNSNPDKTESHGFKPISLFRIYALSLVVAVMFFGFVLYITPLGSMIFSKQDRLLRSAVADVTERITALQDSLVTRDIQLMTIKEVLLNSVDTTFETNTGLAYEAFNPGGLYSTASSTGIPEFESLSTIDILYSSTFSGSLQFPALFPLNGTPTRSFNMETGHFGIDIASPYDTYIRAVADGSVIHAGWAVDSGYVISVQHSDGYLSIYKHSGSIYKMKGDMVLQGDILGKVGNTGMMSSGPHLHFELWRDGVPQNPSRFFSNL